MKKYKTVMFDLDGTLADTSEGVINCVRYAEKRMSLPSLREKDYYKFIGPPNTESYNRYFGLEDEELLQAIKYHKEYAMNKGALEAKLYPGITLLLRTLKAKKIKTAVVTLKMQESAVKLLNNFEVNEYFDIISGATEKIADKEASINAVLQELSAEKNSAVLIGDSCYDQMAAKNAGVDFIGVTYGFGFRTKSDLEKMPYIAIAEGSEALYSILI